MIPSPFPALAFLVAQTRLLLASPTQSQEILDAVGGSKSGYSRHFDIQAHRGGRGNTIENTLPAFAWGLINGATTLELDNGITKDGVVVVWHDENITPAKCQDTRPAFSGDPEFPYVGKYVANLTLAQLKTLDCGSRRQDGYPLQLTYPGTRISTLQEVFDFVECADPSHQVLWNIESKIDARHPNRTASADDFVKKQHALFAASPYYRSITFQSFDWRTLVAMKALDPKVITSALIDDETAIMPDNSTSPWLAGLRLDSFPGPTIGMQVAQAAHSIHANILSPSASSFETPVADPRMDGYQFFSSRDMFEEAHRFGMKVKPWTVNRLNIIEQLVNWKADGVITDYPDVVRRWARQQNLPVAPKHAKNRVLSCLEQHSQL
ncbi:hypothetical protein JAAARDRAFT_349685 [Jaapia argillacea MUCL 33604]|uniref:GP-PDE domain-containing protein n=1 Tax=Jaapia argillacea MUCL 33604 TaxID=933084 RepID=A0A067PJ05_9AGAM|nr:hypothetical protein JAAARDRAFT_349685 [Jaapia argillacea MUCL 33604]